MMTGLLRSRIDASKTITLNQRKVHTQKNKKNQRNREVDLEAPPAGKMIVACIEY